MKLFDLMLRGSGFTLGTLVNDIDHDNFRKLIDYLQCGANEDSEVPSEFKFENKDSVVRYTYPLYTDSDFEQLGIWAVNEGYCTKNGETFSFTEKAIDVFCKTIEISKELPKSGLSYCPCHYF